MSPASIVDRSVLLRRLARRAQQVCFQRALPGQLHQTPVAGLGLIHAVERRVFVPSVYRPSVCVVLQGAKRTTAGAITRRARAGDLIVVSHHVPVVARFTEATATAPYIALVLDVDLAVVRDLAGRMQEPEGSGSSGGRASLQVEPVDGAMLHAFARLLDLIDDDEAATLLGPSIVREVHYRILRSGQGGTLRELLRGRSQANRIARAIEHLRRRFRDRLSIPEVAGLAAMSPSTFHEHFKAVTGTTPLRYQKELRLFEAQRLLQGGGHTVTDAAFDVGYESASQFSREYARKFGRPPRDDRPARS